MTNLQYPLLSSINSPVDLKKLPVTSLKNIAEEVREFIVDTISQVGGHLGAGLGTVELTIALHYVFNTPKDKLVFDTGHQAYPHKILTERKNIFHTIRQFGGISGFLKRDESKYDTFGAGHASTAISAALGIATARDLSNKNFKVVAIVGDGSLTGGMSYEAMNNAGLLKKNLIVILNDNKMVSLSSHKPKLWALHNYFSEALTHPTYNKFKSNVWELTGKLDSFGDRLRNAAHKMERGIKAIITPGMMFEALGFRYFGPFNGHNILKMVEIFEHVKDLNGPILIHINTEKGKGYLPAEKEATRLHGVTPFDKITGIAHKSSNVKSSYTKIFGNIICEIAKQNKKIVAITAAMPDGTGLDKIQKELPEQFFDVGIAEQHAVTFAAGLATEGFIPVCCIYSTFLQRAFDQIIHDVALQKLNVVFVLDRSGIVGADGPTHHGTLDLSYLRCIPNMIVMSPKDENELRNMVFTAVEYKNGPIAIRYPRGNVIGIPLNNNLEKLEIGKGEILKIGNHLTILAIGNMLYTSLKAAEILENENYSVGVFNMRFVKPIDEELILEAYKNSKNILTIEDNVISGGFGSAVAEFLSSQNLNCNLKIHGIPSDKFVEHGTIEELHKILQLDTEGIYDIAKKIIQENLITV